MGIGINLIQTWKIIIVDPKYNLYIKKQAKENITRIGQINCITAHFFICYNVKIERRIKYNYCNQARMIKETV